jgi:hypothetical protein
MQGYEPYVSEIEKLITLENINTLDPSYNAKIALALDGQPGRALRDLNHSGRA